MTTAAELFSAHADSDDLALVFEDGSWTRRELITECRRRAVLWSSLRDPDRPPHIGVLMDNTAEYLFWIGAAALTRSVVVGINSTYRGAELGRLIDHTDCQLLVTNERLRDLLEGVAHAVEPDRVLDADSPAFAEQVGAVDPDAAPSADEAEPDDLLLLIFTSGSTNFPKAVRCTQGRLARTGEHVARITELGPGDAVYSPLPFFHTSSLFTGLAGALAGQVPFGSRQKFSASRTLDDVRSMGATVLTYTGKVLNYILATPERPDDADNPLRLAIGNEASEADIRHFADRFACNVRDSYGSTEGVIIVRRDPSMPAGALGRADDSIKVLDPDTGQECPPARFDSAGVLVNAEEATGELVNVAPGSGFEGYYRNEEAVAVRLRDGMYWSGDLAYRDSDGWFYFAGRSNDWLRVDGENFAAGAVEAIVGRYGPARSAAVFAVPDDPVGDRVMVAIETGASAAFDPADFDAFLDGQTDLGTKWRPSFVRVEAELPKLASMKIDRSRLRREGWAVGDVFWRPQRGEPLRALTDEDRAALEPLRR